MYQYINKTKSLCFCSYLKSLLLRLSLFCALSSCVMDSANSTGSMQSSSTGGDEESYDSRADSSSISAFLNNVGPMTNPPPPQPPPPHYHHRQTLSSSSMFEYPFSNYLDPANLSRSPISLPPLTSTNPNSLLNLDMVWSKNLRSEPNCTDLGGGGFMASSSSQPLLTNQSRTATFHGTNNHFPPPGADSSLSGINIDQPNIIINNNNSSTGMARNPKKRSRASRRAPTTVLTTDTTNFRAMVQEFTGIPAPPFTSTSPFPRTRLDLFGGMPSSFMRSSTATTTHNLDPSRPPHPPYLLRPFAHKIHSQPQPLPFVNISTTTASSSSFLGSSMVDAIASSTTTTTAAANNITSGSASNGNINNSISSSINYQLLSGPSSPHHHYHQNLLNMNMQLQNPNFNLQSLLQAPAKPPGSPLDNIPSNHDLKIGVLEELGLNSHGGGHLSGLQSMLSSSSSDGVGTLSMSMRNNHTITNNFLAAAAAASSISNFNGDNKVLQENVGATTRTEGMVESWICSSD